MGRFDYVWEALRGLPGGAGQVDGIRVVMNYVLDSKRNMYA
jgi:hypothetical protein